MTQTIHDYDYMDMNLGLAYRFLDSKTVLTEAHNHNYYEYFIITSGEIVHQVNGKSKLLKTGSMVLIRPTDLHSYQTSEEQSCKMINVSFSTRYFEALQAYFANSVIDDMLAAEYPPTIILSQPRLIAIKKKHYLLNVNLSRDELIALFKTLAVDVLSYFILEYHTQNQQNHEKMLQTVLKQMNTPENIEEGLPALIRYSGFSHGHLCRIMKSEIGMTPKQFITDLRLQYAANLLTTSDFDILSISMRLGFSSLSHFITIFKKKYGCTPSKYRTIHSHLHYWK